MNIAKGCFNNNNKKFKRVLTVVDICWFCFCCFRYIKEATRMELRSSIEKRKPMKKEEKENINDFPVIKYKGNIHYYTESLDCAIECDKILSDVNKSEEILVIGFDMEWPFSFQTGPRKTALIQMSPSLDECFLFHVSNLQKLPCALTELLAHPNVRLAGVNIKNDIHKLGRDFPGINCQPMLDNCIDSRTQAKIVNGSLQNYSMEKMINYFFKMQMNKEKKVRQSKWNIIPLTKTQQQYAATDAYASLKLYLYLQDLIEKQDF